jgi:glycolate oxidase
VVGNVRLRLVPKPAQVLTLSAYFPSALQAASAVSELIALGVVPRCAELMDAATLGLMRDAGTPCPPGAQAMLILEVDGSKAACEDQASAIETACERVGAIELVVAQSENQREKLWQARKQMSHAVRAFARHKLSEDVVVPRVRLGELLSGVRDLGERHRICALGYGHAGDGNLHVNFLWNTEDEKPRIDCAVRELFELTLRLGGTLSGEHGIGALKAPYLPLEQAPELIALQRDIKRVFDPQGLLNPGKIFPTGHKAC